MKQYVCFIVTAVLLFGAVILSSNFEMKTDEITTTQEEVSYKENRYILKNTKGHLSVFKAGDSSPFIVTETMVENLPKDDQKNLHNGIEITGDSALRKALEDYCS